MPKKQYDSYEYVDPEQIYTYPNSTVLINIQGYTSPQEAIKNENIYVTQRGLELIFKPIFVKTIDDIKDIHRYLFQDVYKWAGSFRKVNISKQGDPFISLQSFSTASQYLNSLFHYTQHET
ncbi:Fic family protein [Lactococcus termiticola]|uniref:protein adenylyltransferase n=1 Tax=Lactococcus termiticola TaxID=2169526 RepID=A0A2R5HKN6_9LACT|nr:Fic family protein [Lactococcus termiticola]GBG97171.1 cell division protein Fic [Lactococcus termiticola]